MKVFSVSEGYRKLRDDRKVWSTYLSIVAGIIGHWIWGVLVAGLSTNTFNLGPITAIVARIVIALIAGIWSFTGIWQQMSEVDDRLRFFSAFTQGFAVDALTGPVVTAIAG